MRACDFQLEKGVWVNALKHTRFQSWFRPTRGIIFGTYCRSKFLEFFKNGAHDVGLDAFKRRCFLIWQFLEGEAPFTA